MSAILNVINYFWKLGFAEDASDVYMKAYSSGTMIRVDLAQESFDFGDAITIIDHDYERFSQRNFVVMESLDRVLSHARTVRRIRLGGGSGHDYTVDIGSVQQVAVRCCIWEDEYDRCVASLSGSGWSGCSVEDVPALIVYTSRLKAGIIEHRLASFPAPQVSEAERRAALESVATLFGDSDTEFRWPDGRACPDSVPVTMGPFLIEGNTLVRYDGSERRVVVPANVERLGNAVFWGRDELVEVVLPERLRSLGGDTFYDCTRLERVVIPPAVETVGDNPFANCPVLRLESRSSHFRLEQDLLLDAKGTRLIYCAVDAQGGEVSIPDGVVSVGKHAFYNCQRLERIILPPTVRIIENNPFSNLPRLRLENLSPHLLLRDGALYNKTLGTLFYYELSRETDYLDIPEGVRIIGRHSFYNCRSLARVTIPSSVATIGYNPFAGCSSLVVENRSPAYRYVDGALYGGDMTELVHYTAANAREEFAVPALVRKIGRSAFYEARHLRRVQLPEGLATIERSAFAHCHELRRVEIPSTVSSIGEWAFFDCPHLEEVRVPGGASLDGHSTFGFRGGGHPLGGGA